MSKPRDPWAKLLLESPDFKLALEKAEDYSFYKQEEYKYLVFQ